MFSHRVNEVMDRRKFVCASGDITVGLAARLMARKHVGAMVVVDNERLAGIFTERDVLLRVVAARRDPEATRVRDVMTARPETVGPHDSYGEALVAMREGGFRHLPVVVEDTPIGIVSARSALDPDLEEFRCEEQRRKHLAQKRRVR